MKKSLLLLTALLATGAFAQVDGSRTIATINGDEIKGSEYYRRMEFLNGVGRMMGRSFAEFPPGFLTLEQLITEKLIMQLAKQSNVFPTDAEVDAEIKFATETDPDLMKDWTAGGRTEAEFRSQTVFNLSQFKLMTRGVNVTDQEVEKYYKDNPALFTIPRMVTLRVIAVSTDEQARAVDADLAAGKAFGDVAKARSLDVTGAMGGEFGKRPMTDLSEVLRKALENVKVGGVTDWIIGGSTRAKFQMVAVDPEVKTPLSDTLKRKIRRELLLTKGNIKNGETVPKEMRELRQKSKIDITEKSFAEAYNKFIEIFVGAGGAPGGGKPPAGGGAGGGGR